MSSFQGPSVSTVLLNTSLGQIKAKSKVVELLEDSTSVSIIQSLGLPFADIPYRWAAPRLISSYGTEPIDATTFGPACPQMKVPAFNTKDIPLFGLSRKDDLHVYAASEDEFKCLNLNIYCPQQQLVKSAKPVPVLVWTFGGGYVCGSGGVPIYGKILLYDREVDFEDASAIVARSVQLGTPIIVVTFNYRVGILGYFHSAELQHDSSKQTDVPPHFRSSGNLALLDAYSAFEWIKKHISEFGGDKDNITAIGESAGAGTLSYLALVPKLHTGVSRMIWQSSCFFSNQLIRPENSQQAFDRICSIFGIESSDNDKVKKLRQISAEDLIKESPAAILGLRPVWDGITIDNDPRSAIYGADIWDKELKALVMGNCANEAFAFTFNKRPANFSILVNSRVPENSDLRRRALDLYNSNTLLDNHESRTAHLIKGDDKAWMMFDEHSRYTAVNNLIIEAFLASSVSRHLYRYHFYWTTHHWPSHWPATHTADILPLFLHKLTKEEMKISLTFLDELLFFVTNNEQRMLWKQFDPDTRHCNRLDMQGQWQVIKEGTGEFGLTAEHMTFWKEVVREIVLTGKRGWPEMA